MPFGSCPLNEEARLRLLHRLQILDTPEEESFNRIVRLAVEIFDVPIALISMLDEHRQWNKARIGLSLSETPRATSICAHLVGQTDAIVVEDLKQNLRFRENPLVLQEPYARFYAGVPLHVDGLVVGSLCLLDTRPRTLDTGKLGFLKDLAHVVERELTQREVMRSARIIQEKGQLELQLSEARFSAVFQQMCVGMAVVSLEGRFIEVNPELCRITGYSESELLQQSFEDITHPDDLAQSLELISGLLHKQHDSCQTEKRYLHRSGATVWAELSVVVMRDVQGEPLYLLCAVQDINTRKQGEKLLKNYQFELEQRVQERTHELERSHETLQAITDNLPILIAQIDKKLRYRFANDVYRQIFGVDPAALIGKPLSTLLRPDLYEELLPCFERALAGARVSHDNVRYSLLSEQIWSATYIPDIRSGEIVGFYIMSQDVTERKQAEQAMQAEAMLDPLTGLPNRRALYPRLERLLFSQETRNVPFAVFFLDLDGFKAVNDHHGHDVGDELLRQVALRLRQTVRDTDFISRLAGDEFVIALGDIADEQICTRVAEGICSALSSPFELVSKTVHIGTSVGIALCRDRFGLSVELILSRADAAMYEAKRKGRNGYRFAAIT